MRGTMMDFPLTITSILRHGAQNYGASEIVTCAGADAEPRRRTFAEVAARSGQLAAALTRLGVQRDDRVATFQWNTAEHHEAYLAIPSMGAVLHTLNIRLFPEQMTYIANHAEDKVVIADHSLLKLLVPLLPTMKTVEHVIVVNGPVDDTAPSGALSYEDLLAAESPDFDWPDDIDEHAAAAMCYTSGTTGNPKGVVYTHRSTYLHAMAVCSGNASALTEADKVLPVVPMFHVNAWGYPYACWMAGADIMYPASSMTAPLLAQFIKDERPTVTGGVPTIWSDLLRVPDVDLSSLRLLVCGGSAVPRALMERAAKMGAYIEQAWGMTETSPIASVARPPKSVVPDSEEAWRYRDTAGRVVAGVLARIVDDEGGVLPRDGKAVGEIEVQGPWVTGSYYGDDDPAKFDHGWLRTGDIGTLDELGFLTITDRSKDVIKSGGEWISSVELENALMAHESVAEAAVVGVPDEKWSERPLAAVVLADGASVDPDELRAFLEPQVAKWWLPERWTFVEAIPRTSVGKFDKKVIRKQYADGELEVTSLDGAQR
jgi:fatty-acyl-CoA synthase